MPSKPFVAPKLIPTWHVLIPAEIQEILNVQICNDAEWTVRDVPERQCGNSATATLKNAWH